MDSTIRNLVRTYDLDRYWSAQFAPAPLRTDLLALYGFDIELSRIADAVREPMAGHVRLQWWRDAVNNAAPGINTGNPSADAFTAVMLRHSLPLDRVLAMIDAREFDLYTDPMPGHAEFTAYLADTSAAVFQLAGQILAGPSEGLSKAAIPAGLAYGICSLLRALPHHLAKGRLHLPLDLLRYYGVETDEMLQGKFSPELANLFSHLRDTARQNLDSFNSFSTGLPRQGAAAFLPMALVRPYLHAMEGPSYVPLRTIAQLNPLRRFWLLWRGFARHCH